MTGKRSAVFGVYSTDAALTAAVEELRARGFRNTDISVLSAQNPKLKGAASDKDVTDMTPSPTAAVGATLGWLVGMGALAMASGVFIVAGPIMEALAKMGEKATDSVGALTGFGIPAAQAEQYQGRVVSGGMLLSVHTDDAEWLNQGRQIFERTGAEEITLAPQA